MSQHVDNELGPAQAAELFRHIDTCGSCAKELVYYKNIGRLLDLKEQKLIDEFFETRLYSTIEYREKYKIGYFLVRKFIPGLVILIFLVIGAINLTKNNKPDNLSNEMLVEEQQAIDSFDNEILEIYYN